MQRKLSSILTKKINSTVKITLNRPEVLNCLNLEMFSSLISLTKQWNADSSTQMIIMDGASRAFCSGGDIRSLYPYKDRDDPFKSEIFVKEYTCNFAIAQMRPIQVCIYDGITMGGGVGISIHAPIRIATENSVFAMPETAIGHFPDVGSTYFLPRLSEGLGLYLGMTGSRLYGRELVAAKVATHYVKSEHIGKLEESLIKESENSIQLTDAQRIVEAFSEYSDGNVGEIPNYEFIKDYFTDNETIENLYEKMVHNDNEFTRKTLKLLGIMSPLSLKVAFKQIALGSNFELDQALNLEYVLSQSSMKRPDFFEGVRAHIVEKDKKPVWQHKSIQEVNDSEVEDYFYNGTMHPIDVNVEVKK